MGKIQFVSMLRWQEPELCLGCLSPAPKLEFQKVLGWVISKILHRAPRPVNMDKVTKVTKIRTTQVKVINAA